MAKARAPRVKRSAAQVANSQNNLVLRKMIQENAIPAQVVSELIQKYLPTSSVKSDL